MKEQVYRLVSGIPSGRVMYYSQIAVLCGRPRAARAVGMIAHFGRSDLPWHRVVSKNGGLARGYWGGKQAHAEALRTEGVEIKDYQIVNIESYLWQPIE